MRGRENTAIKIKCSEGCLVQCRHAGTQHYELILVRRNQFHAREIEIQRLFELGFDNMLLLFKKLLGISLVIQWWRIHLPVQGRQVGSLVWVDPT